MKNLLIVVTVIITFSKVVYGQKEVQMIEEVGNEPSVAVIEVYLKGVDVVAASDYSRSIGFSMGSTGKYAVMERDEIAARFRSVLLTPMKRLQAEKLENIERLVKQGDELVYTDPKQAIEVLNQARAQLDAISAGVAANEKVRSEFLKTEMLLARSHLDAGNEGKAIEVLKEVVRIYGDTIEVTEKDYHPRLVKLFNKVRRDMANEKRGIFTMETFPPGCETLIDGRPLPGLTPREYTGIYPGVHYIQVRCGEMESMIHKVEIGGDKPLHLVIDVGFETTLTVDSGRLGLFFSDRDALLTNLVQYAVKFGSLVNADLVVAHGFTEMGTKADLKAWLIDVRNKSEIKRASVPAKTDVVTPSSVKVLVETLSGSKRVSVSEVESTPIQKRWYNNYIGWSLCGVGLAGLAVGSAFSALYFKHKSNAQSGYGTDPSKWQQEHDYMVDEANKMKQSGVISAVGFGIGGAAIAGGIVLFILTEKKARSQSTDNLFISPLGLRDGGMVMGGVRF